MKIFMKSLTTFLQVIPELPIIGGVRFLEFPLIFYLTINFDASPLILEMKTILRLLNSVFFNKILFYFHHI